ncbi:hypothetical protein K435DRAFT_779897 [Dendrothele bispora CBS 962.96]|uniref:Uncharacterized protein n=1 Tax=Dendrothele bispora (strain CBS 962.96) TaxID=1314807 RepID=A0A4V4HF28_DENBC|nr:hypothetical protein K435DRAFT_779897 [Dendrothele bispora CBS 962.96]
MFGESESESPRVPSPWDSLSPSPSPPPRPPSHQILPRLPPESDLGNVEYKLQLLSPSPSRFTRLVTQLKWRLLEGGGQAYYELGVSDSGLLVGLTRDDLDTSLETLEMMAGEIGASVIVVKEVEVPGRMAEMAKRQEDYRRRGERGGFYVGSAESTTSTGTVTTETETEETEIEQDESTSASASPSPSLHPANGTGSAGLDGTDLFSMDPDIDSLADSELTSNIPSATHTTVVSLLSLEISSVFKPRPARTRDQLSTLNPGHTRRRDAKKEKWKEKEAKQLKWKEKNGSKDKNKGKDRDRGYTSTMIYADDNANNNDEDEDEEENEKEKDVNWKSTNRRLTRDRKREERRKALVAAATESLAAREAGAGTQSVVKTVTTTTTTKTEATAEPEPEPIPPVPSISLTTPNSPELPTPTTTTTTVTVTSVTSTSLLPTESPFLLTLDGVGEGEEEDDDDVFPTPSLPHKHNHFVNATTIDPMTPLSASQELFNEPISSIGNKAKTAGGPTNDAMLLRVPISVPVPVPGGDRAIGSDGAGEEGTGDDLDPDPRYIIEVLVVRKMSLEEAFLDFGGFRAEG